MEERVRVLKPAEDLDRGALYPSYYHHLYGDFSALINETVRDGLIQGIQMAQGAPQISHLFFADDNLLFASANINAAVCLKKDFKIYEKASGQMVNFQKSSLCFSPNVEASLVENIKLIFQVESVARHTKYLCLPSSMTKNRKDIFLDMHQD